MRHGRIQRNFFAIQKTPACPVICKIEKEEFLVEERFCPPRLSGTPARLASPGSQRTEASEFQRCIMLQGASRRTHHRYGDRPSATQGCFGYRRSPDTLPVVGASGTTGHKAFAPPPCPGSTTWPSNSTSSEDKTAPQRPKNSILLYRASRLRYG